MSYYNDTLSEKDRAFIAGMFAAVEERGEDYVYPDEERTTSAQGAVVIGAPQCQYTVTRDGERVGSCIVGLAIQKTRGQVYEGPNRDADTVLRNLTKLIDSEEIGTAALDAQESQDYGNDWGTSLDRFLGYLDRKGYDIEHLRAEYEATK